MSEEFYETVRIEVQEVDTLLESVAEASIQLTALRRESETVERARQLAAATQMPPASPNRSEFG